MAEQRWGGGGGTGHRSRVAVLRRCQGIEEMGDGRAGSHADRRAGDEVIEGGAADEGLQFVLSHAADYPGRGG